MPWSLAEPRISSPPMIQDRFRPIAFATLVALAVPVPAEEPVPPSPIETEAAPEPVKEPPGTKADRALWRDAGTLSNQLTSTRWAANGMHWRIRTEDLSGRLDAAAKADPAAAARLGELRKQLEGAQRESYADLTSKWPIDPTRGCQYPRSMLGAAMEASATRDNRAQLGQARDAAARCVDLARKTLARVKRSTEALGRAIDAAEATLPPVPAAEPPAPPAK